MHCSQLYLRSIASIRGWNRTRLRAMQGGSVRLEQHRGDFILYFHYTATSSLVIRIKSTNLTLLA